MALMSHGSVMYILSPVIHSQCLTDGVNVARLRYVHTFPCNTLSVCVAGGVNVRRLIHLYDFFCKRTQNFQMVYLVVNK